MNPLASLSGLLISHFSKPYVIQVLYLSVSALITCGESIINNHYEQNTS